MPTPTAAPDAVSLALAELVDAGHLTTDQARAAYAAGRAVPPAGRRWDLLGLAIGSAMVGVVVVLLSGEIRDGDDLEWPNFLIALGGSSALLAFALAAWRFVVDPMRRADLMSWPLALGAVGMGFLGGELMGDSEGAPYVAGLAVILLAGGGYWMSRRPAPLIALFGGVALVHFSAMGSLLEHFEPDHLALWVSGALTLFVVLVTVAGWFLPTRNLTAILVGAVGIFGHLSVVWMFVIFGFFGGIMSGGFDDAESGAEDFSSYSDEEWEEMAEADMDEIDDAEDYCLEFAEEEGMTQEECVSYETCYDDDATCMGLTEEECLADEACMTGEELDLEFSDEEFLDDESDSEYEGDVMSEMGFPEGDLWGILGFGLLLLGLWSVCHRLTGHVGYRVLTLVGVGVMVTVVLALVVGDGSVTWAGVPGAIGLAVLALVGFRALRADRADRPQEPIQPEPSATPPVA